MLFRQKVKLIEPTKLLERLPVDTMTFTKPLYHDYLSVDTPIQEAKIIYHPNVAGWKTEAELYYPVGTTPRYNSLYDKTQVPIYAFIFRNSLLFYDTSVIVKNGDQELYKNSYTSSSNGELLTTLNLGNSSENAEITITYTATVHYSVTGEVGAFTNPIDAIFTVSVIHDVAPKPDRTLADVVDRVLNAGLGNQSGKYTLDPEARKVLEKYIAPEFKFTRNNLYEVLLQIGGYSDVQGIPRLKSGVDGRLTVITYDFLSNEEWDPRNSAGEKLKPLAISYESTIDDWCGGFETYAENLIDNSPNGSVRQPCMQTVRTETGQLEIDDNHAIIPTANPIYTVQAVEMGYIDSSGAMVGEISPYIFESSEYNNLTGYMGEYPFAKQFALCYTQGQRNITALTLKPETFTSLGYKLEEMSAIQIAERVSGRSVPSSTGLCKLAYRVTYTPILTARLRQYRPYKDKHDTNNVMFYNQAGNSLDINNYGSNVKNNLIQTGNKVEFLTFRLTKLSQKPKIGQKYNGKYISSADYEYERNWIKVTITLTENYNRKSQYVVLDSRQRFYEISERNVEDRMCNYSFEVAVGEQHTGSYAFSLLRSEMALGAINCLNPNNNSLVGNDNRYKLAYVFAQPKELSGANIKDRTLHELSANAFGNSVVFTFAYEDNYSAGNQAVYNKDDRKLQKAVPYGDDYGEFDRLEMLFYSKQREINTTFADQVSTANTTAFCDALPRYTKSSPIGGPSMQYTRRIMKDGGERISVTTQLHFRANRENVVIGSALAKNCYLVVDKVPQTKAILLKNPLEKWQERVNMNDADNVTVLANDSTIASATVNVGSDSYIYIDFNIQQGEYKACALVTADGEILVGENGDYSASSQPERIHIDYRLISI